MPAKPRNPVTQNDVRLAGIDPTKTYVLPAAKAILGIGDNGLRTLKRRGGLKLFAAAGNRYVRGDDLIAAIQRVDQVAEQERTTG